MTYKLPSILSIEQLDRDQLNFIKLQLTYHQKAIDKHLEGFITSNCYICDCPGYGYQDIPDGWGWLKSQANCLLCDSCMNSWERKFNEKPNVYKKGDNINDNDIQNSKMRLLSNGREVSQDEGHNLSIC
jgi:Zn-finger protein